MKALKWFLAMVLLALIGCSTNQGGTTDNYDTIHGSSPAGPTKEPFRREFPDPGPMSGVPER